MTNLGCRLAPLWVAVVLAMLVGPAAALGDEQSPCESGRGVLIRDWQVDGVPGAEGRPARATMECLDDGRIRHIVEISEDMGRTWSTLFESIYAPVAEVSVAAAPPDPPDRDEPVPAVAASPSPDEHQGEPLQHQAARQTTEEGSEVQALSRELERQEIPVEEAPELVMASPMILEITPGDVSDYAENTAWSTDETAGFICNRVVIRRVTVGRKAKGGDTHLIIGAKLFTKKRMRRLDLLIEALVDGEVVASELLKKVRIGLSIPRHDKTGMMVTALLKMPQQQFDRLFSDDVERKIRLTLTVASG